MRCCACPCLRTKPPCWPPTPLLPFLPPSLLRLRLPVRLPPPLRPRHGTGQTSETVALTTQSHNFCSQDQPAARHSRIRLLSLLSSLTAVTDQLLHNSAIHYKHLSKQASWLVCGIRQAQMP